MSLPSRLTATVMKAFMFREYSMMDGVMQELGRLDTVWSTLLDTLTTALFISVSSSNSISSRL